MYINIREHSTLTYFTKSKVKLVAFSQNFVNTFLCIYGWDIEAVTNNTDINFYLLDFQTPF